MKPTLLADDFSRCRCDLLLVPVFESDLMPGKNPPALATIDESLDGLLLQTAAQEKFKGKAEKSLLLHTHHRLGARQVLLLGLGPQSSFNPEIMRQAFGLAAKTARKTNASSLAAVFNEIPDLGAGIKAATEGLLLGAYAFDRYKTSRQDQASQYSLKDAKFFLPTGTAKTKGLQKSLDLAVIIAQATNWARDLVNEPANQLNPQTLAKHAQAVAREHRLKIDVLDRREIEKLRMGMFLGVARGSVQPPVLIHLRYIPLGKNARRPALALVGKAITFDSGGLCLKPADSMVDMKTDMAGAAAVLAAMKVVSDLAPPFPVHAFVGAAENMLSGNAYRPGDILVSRLKKTVEITNTDAEGRLVLGDVLAWANQIKPAAIVDLATLTGACMVALGRSITGAFGADEPLMQSVLAAAKNAGEEMWRMPLSEQLRDALKSEVADLKNSGERWGAAITAALFLKEFVGQTPWVHLDIAGPATSNKDQGYFTKGATGAGVRTLVELIANRQ